MIKMIYELIIIMTTITILAIISYKVINVFIDSEDYWLKDCAKVKLLSTCEDESKILFKGK